jgi:hypothetical protein
VTRAHAPRHVDAPRFSKALSDARLSRPVVTRASRPTVQADEEEERLEASLVAHQSDAEAKVRKVPYYTVAYTTPHTTTHLNKNRGGPQTEKVSAVAPVRRQSEGALSWAPPRLRRHSPARQAFGAISKTVCVRSSASIAMGVMVVVSTAPGWTPNVRIRFIRAHRAGHGVQGAQGRARVTAPGALGHSLTTLLTDLLTAFLPRHRASSPRPRRWTRWWRRSAPCGRSSTSSWPWRRSRRTDI